MGIFWCVVISCEINHWISSYVEHSTLPLFVLMSSTQRNHFLFICRVLNIATFGSYVQYSTQPLFAHLSSTQHSHFLFLCRVLNIDTFCSYVQYSTQQLFVYMLSTEHNQFLSFDEELLGVVMSVGLSLKNFDKFGLTVEKRLKNQCF